MQICTWFHSSLRRHLKPGLYSPSLFRLTPETSYRWSEHLQLKIHSSSVSGSQKIKSQFTVQMCFIWCLQDLLIFSEHKAHLRHGLTVTLDKSAGWKWRRQKNESKKKSPFIFLISSSFFFVLLKLTKLSELIFCFLLGSANACPSSQKGRSN